MTYKFDDKSSKKLIKMIISIAQIFAILLIFIYIGWTTSITAFLVCSFDFYYTRKINRSNKIRIKELAVSDDTIKFSFFFKSKVALVLKEVEFDIDMNDRQVIFSNKRESIILGIANKEDMENPEKWNNLISELATCSNN